MNCEIFRDLQKSYLRAIQKIPSNTASEKLHWRQTDMYLATLTVSIIFNLLSKKFIENTLWRFYFKRLRTIIQYDKVYSKQSRNYSLQSQNLLPILSNYVESQRRSVAFRNNVVFPDILEYIVKYLAQNDRWFSRNGIRCQGNKQLYCQIFDNTDCVNHFQTFYSKNLSRILLRRFLLHVDINVCKRSEPFYNIIYFIKG